MRIFREVEAGANGAGQGALAELSGLSTNLADVRAIVAVGSARGGVGKSAFMVNLAASLALAGRKTGIVDADLNSPSIVAMLGMKPARRLPAGEGMEPGAGPLGLRIAASNLLPEGEPPPPSFLDEGEEPVPAVKVSVPAEFGYAATLRRLLGQIRFGALDLLLIDLAPGLEQLYRIVKIVPRAHLVLMSHPSELSAHAAKSALDFAAQNSTTVLGIVENMTGFNCDGCHSVRPLMPQGGLATLAREAGVPLLGRLPFDPRFAETCDRGVLFVRQYAETPLAKQIIALAQSLDHTLTTRPQNEPARA
jgi:ATP-binding protein involved in chromosome partitioning